MRPIALVMAAGLAVSFATTARGQVIDWATPVSGSWGTAANWLPANVPDSTSESAVLGLTGPYAVTITNTSYSIGGLTITNPAAELRIEAATGTALTNLQLHGNLVNAGLIRLPSAGTSNNARVQINSNGISFTGGGELRMEEAGDTDLYINVGGGGLFVNGATHTISGAGTITGGGCTLTNEGTILGNRAGGLLILNHFSNAGLVRTVSPGSMTLGEGVSYGQTGTGVTEADGATLTLSGVNASGGTMRAVNGGQIVVSSQGATIGNLTTQGAWEIPATGAAGFTTLHMSGSLTNNGVIRMPSAGTSNNARFQVNANGLTLGGTGSLRMEEAADAEFYINVGGGGLFVNGPAHTISGAGTILGGGCTLTNSGTVLADLAGGLTVANHIENKGLMRTVAPGSMTFQSGMTVTQSDAGAIEADNAVLSLDSATIYNNVVRAVNGGRVSIGPGGGTINGVTAEGDWRILATAATGFTTLHMSGSLTNNAVIRMPSAGTSNNARFQVNANGLTLGGTGNIRMEEAGDAEFYINVGGGGLFVNGPAHTISGAGTLTGGGCTLTNQGAILADLAGGLTISNHISNEGVIRATGSGSMTMVSGSTITQSGAGSVTADGAIITLDSATINNGPVRGINSGRIEIGPGGGTINGVTAEGDWRVLATSAAGHTILHMNGSSTNNALIRMPSASTSNNARFQINTNGTTLSGTGEIRLEEASDTEFYINVGGGGVFINGAGHMISGVGLITGGGCTLTNAGILAPGAPLGSLRVTNAVTMQSTSVVEIELGGDAAAQRDLLDATGSPMTLGGTLKVRFRDGYELPPCSSVIVVRGNLSGVFEAHDLPVMPQGEISVSYGLNTVTIGYIPGDLNGDGLLDFADYLQFLNLYDAQDIRVDFNGDGLVDFADYLEFLNLYDASC